MNPSFRGERKRRLCQFERNSQTELLTGEDRCNVCRAMVLGIKCTHIFPSPKSSSTQKKILDQELGVSSAYWLELVLLSSPLPFPIPQGFPFLHTALPLNLHLLGNRETVQNCSRVPPPPIYTHSVCWSGIEFQPVIPCTESNNSFANCPFFNPIE